MAKIVKGLFGLIGLLFVILIIATVLVANNIGDIVMDGISDHAESIVGVPVSVSDVEVSVLDGTAAISGLRVANPEGFSQPNAFELDRINVKLDMLSLIRPVVVIDRISIEGAKVIAEQVGTTTNLQIIKEKMMAGGDSDASSSSSGDSSDAPNIAIGLFEFKQAKATVKSQQFGEESLDVPDIVLEQIGTPEEGVTIESAAQSLMQPLMKKIIAEIQKQVLDGQVDKALKKALGDKAAQYKEAIKGLFNR